MTPVKLAVAPSIPQAVEAALSNALALGPDRFLPPFVVADASADAASATGTGRLVVEILGREGGDVRRVVPPQPVLSVLNRFARRKSSVTRVDVRLRAERITSVWLPDPIVEAKTLVAVNDVRHDQAERPTLAIGLWSRFAGLWERVGARLAKPEEGLAAEIALAVRPTLILLVDSWRGQPVVIATPDQIAAELAGLALRQARRAGEDDQIGPWQDPLVQRATELDLGVRTPEQLALRLEVVDPANLPDENLVTEWLRQLADLIGVTEFAISAVEPSG